MELSEVEKLFTRDEYDSMLAKIKRRGTYHLFFAFGRVTAFRESLVDNKDPELWINKYRGDSLPPYELILADINNAYESYKSKSNFG